MTKGIFILLGLLMMVSTVEAKTFDNSPDRFSINYAYNDAVNFMERGIEFFIFANGEFDFDVRSNNRSLRIRRNFNGRIRSIGSVYISYDLRGNVTRIGNISMRYFRGRLTNVGDLRVRYDRWELPIFYGNVRDFYYNNGVRFNVSFGDVCDYNDTYFFRNDFNRNYAQFREDRNFYYYRANPNARIGKRSTILKRRKPASVNNSKIKIGSRSSNQSYRKSERRATVKSERSIDSSVERAARSLNKTYRNSTNNPQLKTERKTINRNNNNNDTVKRDVRTSKRTYSNSGRKEITKTEKKSKNRNAKIKKGNNKERKRRG
tara:strand:- start:7539 stop:8495 length:957 start_codon:yes stop_codon:yes gene_type:complete